jgi:hypothetical protein
MLPGHDNGRCLFHCLQLIRHSAYRRIGEFGVGGIAIIENDESSGDYTSH